jgi:glycosyltransferase involved in cell wall biosynthesis
MKVLYIGCYRDGTGWARAAIDYVLALDSAGIEVVPRPLRLNTTVAQVPERLRELESRTTHGCDVVIQHVLPHHMDFDGRFRRCIGLFASETSDFRGSTWGERLQCMDHIWTINHQQVGACRRSGVTRPISVVPHAIDLTRAQRSYRPLDVLVPYRDDEQFLFYWVGEMVRRKNLRAALRAFHAEFDRDEPVQFVIKTTVPGLSADQARNEVRSACKSVHDGMKLKRPKQEIIITERLSDEGLFALHSSCDVFVSTSYGEAWCLPAMEAMAMGRPPIVPDSTGFKDYLSSLEGWLVPTHPEPCFGAVDTFDDLYTAKESWEAIDIAALRRAMREAFSDRHLLRSKAQAGTQKAYEFSHERIGLLMKGLLDERDDP